MNVITWINVFWKGSVYKTLQWLDNATEENTHKTLHKRNMLICLSLKRLHSWRGYVRQSKVCLRFGVPSLDTGEQPDCGDLRGKEGFLMAESPSWTIQRIKKNYIGFSACFHITLRRCKHFLMKEITSNLGHALFSTNLFSFFIWKFWLLSNHRDIISPASVALY